MVPITPLPTKDRQANNWDIKEINHGETREGT